MFGLEAKPGRMPETAQPPNRATCRIVLFFGQAVQVSPLVSSRTGTKTLEVRFGPRNSTQHWVTAWKGNEGIGSSQEYLSRARAHSLLTKDWSGFGPAGRSASMWIDPFTDGRIYCPAPSGGPLLTSKRLFSAPTSKAPKATKGQTFIKSMLQNRRPPMVTATHVKSCW